MDSVLRFNDLWVHNRKVGSGAFELSNLNVLTGPTGSGKSSLLACIDQESRARMATLNALASLTPSEPTPRSHRGTFDGVPRTLLIDHSAQPRLTQHTIGSFLAIDWLLHQFLARGPDAPCQHCASGTVSWRSIEDFAAEMLAEHQGQDICLCTSPTVPTASSTLHRVGTRIESLDSTEPQQHVEIVIDRLKLARENRARLVASLQAAIALAPPPVRMYRLSAPRILDTTAPIASFSPLGACSSCSSPAKDLAAADFDMRYDLDRDACRCLGGDGYRIAPGIFLDDFCNQSINSVLTYPLTASIKARLAVLSQFGLGYLSLSRSLLAISSGELQRLRIAAEVHQHRHSLLYLIDEPSIGLHVRDATRVQTLFSALIAAGNGVLCADSSRIFCSADARSYAISAEGLVSGAPPLPPQRLTARKSRSENEQGEILVQNASLHNLNIDKLSIPLNLLVGVHGVSGSGKSSLCRGILAPGLCGEQVAAEVRVSAPNLRVVTLERARTPRTSRSTVASALGIATTLREWYAKLPQSRMYGFSAKNFQFNPKEETCPACHEAASDDCAACLGTRLPPAILAVRWRGLSIAELFTTPLSDISELLGIVLGPRSPLQAARQLEVLHLSLQRKLESVSYGELQRLQLARAIAEAKRETIFILDEPCAGVTPEEGITIAETLKDLCAKQGHTVIAIEHTPRFLSACDWCLEIGPGAGPEGGRVVSTGHYAPA